jgi:hypothetical protein
MTPQTTERSIADLFRDLLNQLIHLLRVEGQLARAEMSEKIDAVTRGVVLSVVGAVLVVPAIVVLLGAGVVGLTYTGLETWAAALIVGGAALLIGAILVSVGVRAFRIGNLAPRRTIGNLQRDMTAVRHQMRNEHEVQRTA